MGEVYWKNTRHGVSSGGSELACQGQEDSEGSFCSTVRQTRDKTDHVKGDTGDKRKNHRELGQKALGDSFWNAWFHLSEEGLFCVTSLRFCSFVCVGGRVTYSMQEHLKLQSFLINCNPMFSIARNNILYDMCILTKEGLSGLFHKEYTSIQVQWCNWWSSPRGETRMSPHFYLLECLSILPWPRLWPWMTKKGLWLASLTSILVSS